jgi:hypothetical protein
VSRFERYGWIVVLSITAVLVLMALSIVAFEYWGNRRIEECRRGEMPQSDSWYACTTRGSLFG